MNLDAGLDTLGELVRNLIASKSCLHKLAAMLSTIGCVRMKLLFTGGKEICLVKVV